MALKFLLALILTVSVVKADRYHSDLPPTPLEKIKNQEEINPNFWRNNAKATLQSKLKQQLNTNDAKNIIFFIGDGMSMQTVAATRVYEYQAEEKYLSFEEFPHVGLVSTYCVNRKVADSACTSTAYLSGIKGNYGTIGINAQVSRYDCKVQQFSEHHTESILSWAQKAGKSTGFVTTTRVTHASPAGVYAKVANRYWESDVGVAEDNCDTDIVSDIAEQLVRTEVGQNLNVILGGGRKNLLSKNTKDEEGYNGERTDGKNLINEWKERKESKGQKFEYVWNKTALHGIQDTDYLMGLFESDHCRYNLDIKNEKLTEEPTLTEMVEAALKVLEKNENGYFLFVEGGRIDTAHHDSHVQRSLEETAEMARAVKRVQDLTNSTDTLIVVSADHSHTMMYAGYPDRGNDILGYPEVGEDGNDGLPYPTLSYANGKGYENTYKEEGGRVDFSKLDYHDPDFQYPGTVPLNAETHAGDHVGVWATGPQSHLFEGTYEQNSIPILMAYISKIGPYKSAGVILSISNSLLGVLILFWLRNFS